MRFISLAFLPVIILIAYKSAQVINPGKPVENTIIISLLALLGWLGKMVFTLKADEGSFKSQIDSLKSHINSLEKETPELEKENISLKEQIAEKARRETLISTYEFNARLGIYTHKVTNQAVCPRCLLNKSIVSPLKTEDVGWNCFACEKFFPNPDYTPPDSLHRYADTD